MNKKLAALITFCAAAALSAACSSSKSTTGTPTGSGTPTSTGTPEVTTLIAIHTTHPTVGQQVTLNNLVVTAMDADGDFWAQDATFTAGGLNEGGYFYNKNKGTPTGLAIGNIISVTGAWNPYSGPASDPWTGPFVSFEIDPTATGVTITTPSTTAPTPLSITSLSLLSCPESSDLQLACPAQPYEDLFVSLSGTINTVGEGFDNYGIATAAGGATGITVDNAIFDSYETSRVGDAIAIVGVIDNNFLAFHIEPRTVADITITPVGNPNTLTNAKSFASINAMLTAPPAFGQLVTFPNGTAFHVVANSPYTNTDSSKTLTSFWAQDGTAAAVSTGLYFNDAYYMIGTPASVSSSMTITSTTAKPISGKFVNTGTFYPTGTTPPSYAGAAFEFIVGFADMQTAAGGGNYITGVAGTALTPLGVTCANTLGYSGIGTTFQTYEGLLVNCTDVPFGVVSVTDKYGDYDVGPGTFTAAGQTLPATQCGTSPHCNVTVGNYDVNTESMGATATTSGTLPITSLKGVFNGNKGFQEIEPVQGGLN